MRTSVVSRPFPLSSPWDLLVTFGGLCVRACVSQVPCDIIFLLHHTSQPDTFGKGPGIHNIPVLWIIPLSF